MKNLSISKDKTILVGCYKNKKHFEWINSKGVYNIRLGLRKGALEKDLSLFSRVSLLVLYDIKSFDKLLVFDVKGYKEMTGSDLSNLDYPNKKIGKNYMTFKITLSTFDTKELVNQHFIEKLNGSLSKHVKGAPIILEP